MNRKILMISACLYSGSLFAITPEEESREEETSHETASYISPNNYLQNPYLNMPSLAGNQQPAESALESHSVARRLFNDGTWNVQAAASYYDQNGGNNYGGGINLFGQTGRVGGFSVGGFLTMMNPYSNQINPSQIDQQALGLSIKEQIAIQELFVEYKFAELIQVDVGWIGINNNPWLTYYQNNALNLVTYQGASANAYLGGGWLLSALAINKAQLLGETGFNDQSYYNLLLDPQTATGSTTTAGTVALGSTWNGWNNNLNFRLWGYQFNNYSNLLYADSDLNLKANNQLSFTISAQGAYQFGSTNNMLNNNGFGQNIQSNMLGLQLGMTYDWFNLKLGYNNIWGPSEGAMNGNIISPYTYTLATDPLYTTSWITGLVDRSAGQALKIAPTISFLDDALQIGASAAYFQTSFVPSAREYDLTISYAIPQIKGLTIFGGYGYIDQAANDPEIPNGYYEAQLMLTYLY